MLVLVGCDPARVMIVKGPLEEGILTVYGDSASLIPRAAKSIGKARIEAKTGKEVAFLYGLGGWRNTALMPHFAESIDSIVVSTTSGKRILKDKETLTDYLIQHRKGFAKRKLIIQNDF